jgi:hypothetical protein
LVDLAAFQIHFLIQIGFWQHFLLTWIELSRSYENAIKAYEYWLKVLRDSWLIKDKLRQQERGKAEQLSLSINIILAKRYIPSIFLLHVLVSYVVPALIRFEFFLTKIKFDLVSGKKVEFH